MFHTLCTLISIIEKRFQDAGLRDLCIASGVVAEGSLFALMEGYSYNRVVHFYKRSYEAFRRVAWAGFLPWVESHHPQDVVHINKALEDIGNLADNLQKSTHDFIFNSQAFQVLFERSEECMEHLHNTTGLLGYAQGNNGHADLQKSKIKKEEKDVQEKTDLLVNSWLNPFSDEFQPLASILTSAVPSPDIALDLAKAYLSGEAAYQDFKNNRLEPEKLLVKFHHTLKKQKLNTFSSMLKAKTIKKNKGEETVICADRNLFARMIIIAESRLQHPLCALPSCLAMSNGLLCKTNKAQLGRELEKLVQ